MATLRATFHGIASQMSRPGYEYCFIDVTSAEREVKARSKGFATLRNVSKLTVFDMIGHAKSVDFRFYSGI